MTLVRRALGWGCALTAASLNEISHTLLHAAAWLMDHDRINNDCPNCAYRRDNDLF